MKTQCTYYTRTRPYIQRHCIKHNLPSDPLFSSLIILLSLSALSSPSFLIPNVNPFTILKIRDIYVKIPTIIYFFPFTLYFSYLPKLNVNYDLLFAFVRYIFIEHLIIQFLLFPLNFIRIYFHLCQKNYNI